MENKKPFFMGLALGAMIMLALVSGSNAIRHNIRWGGGLDPTSKVIEIYSLLNTFSIMPFEKSELLDSMYRGFLDGVGDPYTQYLNLEALEAFHTRTDGQFVGIGVRFLIDPEDMAITLAVVFSDSPAARVGLMPGDKIHEVDGVNVIGRPSAEAVSLIQGPQGTNVRLTIFRPYENREFYVDITRDVVEAPSVYHTLLDCGQIGHIRIASFERPTFTQFEEALGELTEKGMEKLILDVRNNPGGLLDSVTRITNRLIPEGVILFTEDVNENRNYFRSNAEYLGIPMVVLVNEFSASASEVISGAIQDSGAGVIVGQQTFGKGIVQNLMYLSDGTAIKLTVSKYFTPSGDSIHGIGVIPDIVVDLDESLTRRIGDLHLDEDAQLQKAIEIVSGM